MGGGRGSWRGAQATVNVLEHTTIRGPEGLVVVQDPERDALSLLIGNDVNHPRISFDGRAGVISPQVHEQRVNGGPQRVRFKRVKAHTNLQVGGLEPTTAHKLCPRTHQDTPVRKHYLGHQPVGVHGPETVLL